MPQRRKRIVVGEVRASVLDGHEHPEDSEIEAIEEWAPEGPTEEWSDWEQVGEKIDQDPTYIAEYDYRRASIFHVPLKAMHPHRRRTVTWERRLLRRWVDPQQGPMVEVVRTEQRVDRY